VSATPVNPLQLAATRRSQEALKSTRAAIRALDQRGEPVSILGVSKLAGVSRQFIYDHGELRRADRSRGVRVPAREQATVASLESRLRAALAENRRLRTENQELRAELAVLYGEAREAEIRRVTRANGQAAQP
jgi:hypothetical protein